MGQREDVTASLLASHGVDGVARRKVADQVREVVKHGTEQVAIAALAVGSPLLPHTQEAAAKAASAVVLASDLRAPSDDPSTFEAVQAVYRDAGAEVLRREGWRARLANVERLLTASLDSKTPRQASETVVDALTEIRAMLDGE